MRRFRRDGEDGYVMATNPLGSGSRIALYQIYLWDFVSLDLMFWNCLGIPQLVGVSTTILVTNNRNGTPKIPQVCFRVQSTPKNLL